jgi:hypothetical protein
VVQPAPTKSPELRLEEIDSAVTRFLQASSKPVLIDPGEDPLPIAADNFVLELRGSAVTLECWNTTRNLVRRVRGVHSERSGQVELEVERFGGLTGTLLLVDLAHPSNGGATRRGGRVKFRELFRLALRRQYAGWKLVELSTEPDLHHSLSPSYSRAFLRRGSTAIAAIGAAEDCLDPDGALSFGLIWLDYLRRRESKLAVTGLVVFLPIGVENTTCHRVRYLDPRIAQYTVFVYGAGTLEELVNPHDYTNFDTRLEPFCRPVSDGEVTAWVERLAAIDGVEQRPRPDGSVTLAVRGLEFARTSSGTELLFGIDERHAGGERHLAEIEDLARGLGRMRSAGALDRTNPLYLRHPEAWLESQVRRSVSNLDATLRERPLYSQAPQFAAGNRGILDLLAVDYDGRLTVIEVKASQDIHLPLQALDYWMRVKWHLERNEFAGRGYFPGVPLRSDPPRLLLVAPALDFHPTNEALLRYFSPEVQVERIGVGIEWRQELRVMFRAPAGTARACLSGFLDKSSTRFPA